MKMLLRIHRKKTFEESEQIARRQKIDEEVGLILKLRKFQLDSIQPQPSTLTTKEKNVQNKAKDR